MDYVLDRAQIAFVVGRETSNTCQGFRLKALSSLTSALCKKYTRTRDQTLCSSEYMEDIAR